MKKLLILCLAAGFLSACTSYKEELAPSPGKCFVETRNSLFIETHIQSIDGGPDLTQTDDGEWAGDKSWLDPGEHTFVIVCVAEYPWSKVIENVPVSVELQKGYRYELWAKFDAKTPSVEVKELPHLTHGFFWTR